ncbi:MAG: (d)CMP kinase [Nocardiopsaceae bacterium]|nr:(d)CMP kinase [Nocardiopsaceae bacterium]
MGNSSSGTLVIAVDGPSGSGKSSASRGVARELGLRYLDTGATYRAITWLVLSRDVDPADRPAVAALVRASTVEISTDPDDQWVILDGRDISRGIRTREVDSNVSAVAAVAEVRERMTAMQREIIAKATPGIVAEGRDVGRVVAPDAVLKVYLTADPEARARRRAPDRGLAVDVTVTDQARRDRLDAAQSAKADDAVLIDATDLTLEQVIGEITALARERSALAYTGDLKR